MKKNRTMRVAALLLALTLMTSCFVGGTFAKYTTSGSADDTARVAKFGVTVTGSGYLFAETYKNVAEGNTPGTEGATLTVVSKTTGDKVVAPGTKSNGDGMNINISGTPEVDIKVTHDATITLTGWVVDGEFYCPLVFTINNTKIDGSDYYKNYSNFVNALTEAIEGTTGGYSYEANTDLGVQPNNQIKITWEWPFDGDDAKDTKLGNLETAPTVSIKVVTTVDQVD